MSVSFDHERIRSDNSPAGNALDMMAFEGTKLQATHVESAQENFVHEDPQVVVTIEDISSYSDKMTTWEKG